MHVSDEELMAFVDGELDAKRHEALRRAIESDVELARRVAAQQVLRRQLRGAFDPILNEAIPSKLTAALSADRAARVQPKVARRQTMRNTWLGGLALAAGFVLGVWAVPAYFAVTGARSQFVSQGGELRATGSLDQALSMQLASDVVSTDSVRMGVTFVSKRGEYCRTFSSGRSDKAFAGLACRNDGGWRVDALQSLSTGFAESNGYRQAASAIPPLVVEAAQAAMAGEALDADAEAQARDHQWIAPRGAP